MSYEIHGDWFLDFSQKWQGVQKSLQYSIEGLRGLADNTPFSKLSDHHYEDLAKKSIGDSCWRYVCFIMCSGKEVMEFREDRQLQCYLWEIMKAQFL